MVAQLTISLYDNIYDQAQKLASLTGRSIEEMVSAMLELSVSPFVPQLNFDDPISNLADSDVMALTNLQMRPERDQRLSYLLARQAEGESDTPEQIELQTLMRVYEIGLIYKSQALAEAVKRGIHAPLQP